MRRPAGRRAARVVASITMSPALLRAAVRRARRSRRASVAPLVAWTSDMGQGRGTLEVPPSRTSVLLDGVCVGRLSVRHDAGTSTAECSSHVPAALASAVVELVAASARTDVRRIAWFAPEDDTALETALASAGFVCEAWAAPPVGDGRPHRQWSLLV